MRVIRRISAVIIGFVFFLSGVLKLMDPVGATLVMEEYFKFLHLGFLSGISGLAGIGMALLEALLGAALITGVWRKVTGMVTGMLLALFTLLTALLYVKNPNMDCGCFGEIIHLTHLQSLLKNGVLLVLWALAFLPLRKQERTRKIKFVSFPIAAVSVVIFMIWSLMRIPLVDFTPFKPGAELMLPEDIDDPTDDRTPTLSLSDASGEYVDDLLMDGDLLAVSVYDPESMHPHQWERVFRLVRDAEETGFRPLVLAAATPAVMEELLPEAEMLHPQRPRQTERLRSVYPSGHQRMFWDHSASSSLTRQQRQWALTSSMWIRDMFQRRLPHPLSSLLQQDVRESSFVTRQIQRWLPPSRPATTTRFILHSSSGSSLQRTALRSTRWLRNHLTSSALFTRMR